MGFCNIGADGILMSICNSMWHLFGQTIFNLAFVVIFINSFSIWLWFRADVFQIPQHRKALSVTCHLKSKFSGASQVSYSLIATDFGKSFTAYKATCGRYSTSCLLLWLTAGFDKVRLLFASILMFR